MFKYINHDEYKTLDDVCILITDGTHNPPKFVESGIPFILVSNITGNIVTYETPKYITENDYRVLMKRTPIEKGDVLLSTVGSYGHPAIVTEDRPFAFQRHIAHLKPNRDLLTSEYLHAAILSSIVQEQIEILILGVAQKTLNLSAIRQIKIPVPSIEEQNVFVSFVEQSDKSKFACLKSQFIEMFGDPITNNKKLPVEPLSKHIELLGGFAFKSTGFVKEGIPVLRIGNINAGYFRPDDLPFWKYDKALDRYLLYPGDLAISLTGTVGKDDYGNVCRLGNDYPRYYLNQRNAKLILKDTVLPEFITALLKNRKIKDKIANAGVGVRQANISNKSILELKVPIPNLDGQNQFADFVRQSDKSK